MTERARPTKANAGAGGAAPREVRWGIRRAWRLAPGRSALVPASWLLLACTAASTRPRFEPLPGALVDTLRVGPGQAIASLALELQAAGLVIRAQSPAEGYLETRWYDPVTRRSVGRDHRHVGLVFRLRAYADSVPPLSSQLVVETVYRRTADPSAPGREEEILVPPGHPGDSLTQRVLDRLRRQFGGPARTGG